MKKKNAINPLIERRDYGVQGHDALELDALKLKQEGKLPKDMEKQLKNRLKPFPARQASIIDYPKENLSPWVWDLSENPPKVKEEIKTKIIDDVMSVLDYQLVDPAKWVFDILLTGSIVTNQYVENSCLDVNVSIDFDIFRTLHPFLNFSNDIETRAYIRKVVSKLNGCKIAGQHPTKYCIVKRGKFLESDAIYDLKNNKWLKSSIKVSRDFDPDKAFKKQKIAAMKLIDLINDLFVRMSVKICDLCRVQGMEMRKLDKEDMIKEQIKAIVSALKETQDIIKQSNTSRFKINKPKLLEYAFSKNWEENNIIFKYVEKYGYSKPLNLLNETLTTKEKNILSKNHINLETL